MSKDLIPPITDENFPKGKLYYLDYVYNQNQIIKSNRTKNMNKILIKTIEDIYPLTIIQMRYGGKYVIFNATCDADFISSVEGDEEVYYNINKWLEENVSPCYYGIGETIDGAFEDFKIRYNK